MDLVSDRMRSRDRRGNVYERAHGNSAPPGYHFPGNRQEWGLRAQVAYDDDYRFHPDPVMLFKVPEDAQEHDPSRYCQREHAAKALQYLFHYLPNLPSVRLRRRRCCSCGLQRRHSATSR